MKMDTRRKFPRAGMVVVPLTGLAFAASLFSQIPAARDVVKPSAYASFEPVARGKEMQIAVVMKIRDGYHVNARQTTFDYLIPTDLKAVELPAGFKAGEVSYPKGTLHKFNFTKDKPLNVYTDTVVLRLPITVEATAAAGRTAHRAEAALPGVQHGCVPAARDTTGGCSDSCIGAGISP